MKIYFAPRKATVFLFLPYKSENKVNKFLTLCRRSIIEYIVTTKRDSYWTRSLWKVNFKNLRFLVRKLTFLWQGRFDIWISLWTVYQSPDPVPDRNCCFYSRRNSVSQRCMKEERLKFARALYVIRSKIPKNLYSEIFSRYGSTVTRDNSALAHGGGLRHHPPSPPHTHSRGGSLRHSQ